MFLQVETVLIPCWIHAAAPFVVPRFSVCGVVSSCVCMDGVFGGSLLSQEAHFPLDGHGVGGSSGSGGRVVATEPRFVSTEQEPGGSDGTPRVDVPCMRRSPSFSSIGSLLDGSSSVHSLEDLPDERPEPWDDMLSVPMDFGEEWERALGLASLGDNADTGL